ncbi:hypothetical protein KSS87_002569 [Heliosperma pusillum]|nr:hypothetical protein KSS87_002569 [Heliosperma pusillum]
MAGGGRDDEGGERWGCVGGYWQQRGRWWREERRKKSDMALEGGGCCCGVCGGGGCRRRWVSGGEERVVVGWGGVWQIRRWRVPFEEDDKDLSIWFLDHNYHESMFSMFRRINAKEHVVGWYSTGPKLRENDLDIHRLFNDYVPNPVLVIIDVQPEELGIPTKAYYAIEEVKENATQKSQKVFAHVVSEIAAHEVEEIVLSSYNGERACLSFDDPEALDFSFNFETCSTLAGVEHLLRDVTGKLAALKGLDARLREIRGYLDLVIDGKLPLNHEILYHLQDVFNLLPNLSVPELIKAFAVKTNDMMLVIYLSSLIRSVIALHNLINNKMLNKEHEKAEDSKPVVVPAAAS